MDGITPIPYATPVPFATAPSVRHGFDRMTSTSMGLDGSAPTAPVAPPRNSEKITESQIDRLKQQGYTRGLAESIGENNDAFALRIWIVDNSGSMAHPDGHRFIETNKSSNLKVASCTRWKEIQETVEYHAQMAAMLKAPTIFRLLNDPGSRVGPQIFGVADKGDHMIDSDLQVALTTMQNASPGGVTPLCRHIYECQKQIALLAPQLNAEGRKIAIIIATDGLPTDERGYGGLSKQAEFTNALRSLEGLPVWIVIRLCTDEDDVVNFYNDLDSQLELSIEVLDDFIGEATEVHSFNRWLNYSLVLHRCREMGFQNRLFDLLDERKLTKTELREFCTLMLGKSQFDGVPDPELSFEKFGRAIATMVKKEEKQWNPMKKIPTPIIDMKKYADSEGCTIS